jgi:hypothetical protein
MFPIRRARSRLRPVLRLRLLVKGLELGIRFGSDSDSELGFGFGSGFDSNYLEWSLIGFGTGSLLPRLNLKLKLSGLVQNPTLKTLESHW